MPSTDELSARYGPRYRWLATATALVSAISVILSATIVNVAIPDVMGAFGIDQTKAQWLSTGFLAAMTATMLLTDWAQRALGERTTVTAAMTLFMLASFLGGTATDENVLILARVLQGAAAGIVQPLAMLIIFQVFPPERRGAAMGIFGVGVVLAPALGPWVGGLLIDAYNWRYIFYLGVPPALLAVALGNLFLPTRAVGVRPPAFDWLGFGLLAASLTALLTGLSNGQRWGWSSDATLACLAAAGAALAVFVWWEGHSRHPMLDLRVFRNGPFAAACVVSFVLGAGLFGSTYLLPLFVQTVQGFTPTQAGLLLMPAGLVMVAIFPSAGALTDRMPAAALVAAGLLIFAWASYLTASADVDTAFWPLAWWTAMTRIGMGLVFPALNAGSLRVLSPQLMAQGSGTINFTRQLGGAFGVNLLAVLLERLTVMNGDFMAATQTASNGTTGDYLGAAEHAIEGLALAQGDQQAAALWLLGRSIYSQANTLAFQQCFLITALVFLVALLPTWYLHRAQQRARPRPAPGRIPPQTANP